MRLKADLHIHSTYSDGRCTPKDIILEAINKGIEIISITDHNSFQGAIIGSRYAKELPDAPLVIIGNEVRTDLGDILVYCLEAFDPPRNALELIDRAHENNCLLVPAHPFDIIRHGVGENLYSIRGWDAVEVWNASAPPNANKEAIKAAKILGLPGIASSDAHIPEYIGVAYTVIDVDEPSVENVLEAVKRGRVQPHYGYPDFRAFVKRVSWSIRRRLGLD